MTPLLVYVTLLIGLPSGLVFGPLGAAGAPAAVLGLLFLAWWVNARLVPRLGVDRGRQPMRVAIYVFLGTVATSYLVGALRPKLSEETSSSDRGVLTALAWAGVLLVTADGLRTRRSLDRLLTFLVGAGAVLALIGIVESFTGWNAASLISIPGLEVNRPFANGFERTNFRRIQGTASHPIELGVVLTMILPLALHYAWFAPAALRRRRWLTVGLIAFALPLTVSRSAIVGLAVVMIVLLLTWPPAWRRKVLLVSPFFVVVLQALSPGLLHTLKQLFLNTSSDPSTQGRTDDFDAVGWYVSQDPLLGRGISTFIPEIYRTLDNAYLGWVVEAGWLGLLALLGLVVAGVLTPLHARSRTFRDDVRTRDLGASLAASVLAAGVSFATFDALGFGMCAGMFFLLLGAGGALWRLAPPDSAHSTRPIRIRRWQDRFLRPRFGLRLLVQSGAAALAAAFVVLTPGVLRADYVATGSILLQGPDLSDRDKLTNPYVYSPYVDLAAVIMQRLVTSPSTAAELAAAGYDAPYTTATGIGSLAPRTDKLGFGPLIRVQAVSGDAVEALATRDAVMREFGVQLREQQAGDGLPPGYWLQQKVVTAPVTPGYLSSQRNRAVAAAAILGFVAGSLGWHLARRIVRHGLSRPAPRRVRHPAVTGGEAMRT